MVVVGEQLGRRLRGAKWVEAIVHGVVDMQVAPAGRTHELPEPRCTDLRIGRRIERGLHVRKHGKLRGQSQIGERLGDVRLPRARALQALSKAVGLAKLKADVLGRLEVASGRALCAPHVANVLIVG